MAEDSALRAVNSDRDMAAIEWRLRLDDLLPSRDALLHFESWLDERPDNDSAFDQACRLLEMIDRALLETKG